MSKYRRLKEYLYVHEGKVVKLKFEEIEEIIGFELPESAYLYRAWWANSSHNALRVWAGIGWYVTMVDFEGKVVEFEKRDALQMSPQYQSIDAKQALALVEKMYELYNMDIIDERTYREKKRVLLEKIR